MLEIDGRILLAGDGIVPSLGRRCLLVLDAYFAVGPVLVIFKSVVDSSGDRLVHVVTRAKSNVVGYEDPPQYCDISNNYIKS